MFWMNEYFGGAPPHLPLTDGKKSDSHISKQAKKLFVGKSSEFVKPMRANLSPQCEIPACMDYY